MIIEIEHKYLVKAERWKQVTPFKIVPIRQAYLSKDPEKTIRIRVAGDKGFITIKGKSVGASRPEYEYEIPLAEAEELIKNFCNNLIEKTRHYVLYENKTWEVDIFEGLNSGLIIAEIELNAENEEYSKPDWIDHDVTTDKKYANSNLTVNPFTTW
ncbi:MAG: CYTH domain-containing protein [Bacteroidia bacterium]